MATIGLYSLDLWHRTNKAMPNLELMKIYNYHFTHNDIVMMMRPRENEGRFSKIIYFKDNPKFSIPRNVSVSGPNKEICGYGFYKKFFPIDDIYANEPPSYYPYEPYTERLYLNDYKKIKRSSYIRFENKDFADYKKEKPYITFADYDAFYVPNIEDFMKENKNHSFIFVNPIEIKDEETFLKFIPYSSLINRRFQIQYHFSEDMFKSYFLDNVVFDFTTPWPQETENQFLQRIVSMILYYKINRKSLNNSFVPPKEGLLKDIQIWGNGQNCCSFYQYYENNKDALLRGDAAPSEVRLLLKSNPQKMKSSDIDFKGIL